MYYRTCPNCGCNLDPDERCDCRKAEGKQYKFEEILKHRGYKKGAYHERKPQ